MYLRIYIPNHILGKIIFIWVAISREVCRCYLCSVIFYISIFLLFLQDVQKCQAMIDEKTGKYRKRISAITSAIAVFSKFFRRFGNQSIRLASRIKCKSLFPESLKTISLSDKGSREALNGLFLLLALFTKKESTPKSKQKPLTISEESL